MGLVVGFEDKDSALNQILSLLSFYFEVTCFKGGPQPLMFGEDTESHMLLCWCHDVCNLCMRI